MPLPVLVSVLFVVLAVAVTGLLVVAPRSGRGRDLVGSQLAAAHAPDRGPSRGPDDAELRRQIEVLLRQKSKIHAIKLLRDQRPMSLRDAKTEVERIEAGLGSGTAVTGYGTGVAGFGSAVASPPSGYGAGPAGVPPEVIAQVRELKSRNQLIQAIKVMREHTGMGLRDAKEAVERL
jgi:large subunit ribosomal protein L7/L12